MENLIHIAFDAQGAEQLRQSFSIDDIIAGEVVVMSDDLSFGPLRRKETPDGESPREAWWKEVRGSEEYAPIREDAARLASLREKMKEDENNEIWIWAAQNARDVCGYYSLILPFADFQGRVSIIYLNNLPFLNEKGSVFYPRDLGEILPREFLKARKLAREITPAEIEVDGEEWRRMVQENALVRVLEGGKKISSHDARFFDREIIQRCRLDFMKAGRLAGQLVQKGKDHVDEDFLIWRIRAMVEEGLLEARAEAGRARELEVKAPGGGGTPAEGEVSEQHQNEGQD